MAALGIGDLSIFKIYYDVGYKITILLHILIILTYLFITDLMIFGYLKFSKKIKSFSDLYYYTCGKLFKTLTNILLFFAILFSLSCFIFLISHIFFNQFKDNINTLLDKSIKKE